jgi:hypothetical protein
MHATNGEILGCSFLVSPQPGEGYLYDGSEVETIYTMQREEKEMGEKREKLKASVLLVTVRHHM